MQKRRNLVVVLWAAVGLFLGGCATNKMPLSDLPAQELAGHYVSGTGESWFTPCGAAPADGSWWVTLTGQAVERIEQARAAGQLVPGQRYFVRWRAAVTTDGQIGPRGPGLPALLVREVLELRAASDNDCVGR
jgi:hypothetical protein